MTEEHTQSENRFWMLELRSCYLTTPWCEFTDEHLNYPSVRFIKHMFHNGFYKNERPSFNSYHDAQLGVLKLLELEDFKNIQFRITEVDQVKVYRLYETKEVKTTKLVMQNP